MDKLLHGQKDFLQIDIAIYSDSWEEHSAHIKEMLSMLREAGLTVNEKKMCLGTDPLRVLGHLVGRGKVQPSTSKIDAVANFVKTKKTAAALLGSSQLLLPLHTELC